MKLETHKGIYTTTLDLGETLLINFNPLGWNAPVGSVPSKPLTVVVATMSLPSGHMALRFEFPYESTYRFEKAGRAWATSLVVLDNPNKPDELAVSLEGGPELRFKQFVEEEKDGCN